MCVLVLSLKVGPMSQIKGSQAGGIALYLGYGKPFCSLQIFNQLYVAHLH